MSGYSFNPRYKTPSPEVMRRLELSRMEAERVKKREMHCPVCGFLVSIIPVTQTEVVFVRCRKCKFEGALSPAYFRRIKRIRAYGSRLERRCDRRCRCIAEETGRDAYGKDLYLY